MPTSEGKRVLFGSTVENNSSCFNKIFGKATTDAMFVFNQAMLRLRRLRLAAERGYVTMTVKKKALKLL
mgnify:CR=1 FL=1